MSDELKFKIRELCQELKSLRERQDSFVKDAKRQAEKRDLLHKQIGDLRLEAASARERRDKINSRVKALKTERDQTRGQVKEKIEEIRQLREKLRLLSANAPRKPAKVLRKEKDEIEWKIQTSSLTLQEEKPLVDRANGLEIMLSILQEIDNAKGRIMRDRSEIEAMNKKSQLLHTSLSELAAQSQELHKKMIEAMEKGKAIEVEADKYHQDFLQCKKKSREIREECRKLEKNIQVLERELAEINEKERKLRQEETTRKLKAEVAKKLKNGKKLSLEEFKLLAGDDNT